MGNFLFNEKIEKKLVTILFESSQGKFKKWPKMSEMPEWSR